MNEPVNTESIDSTPGTTRSIEPALKPKPDRSILLNQWVIISAFFLGIVIGAFGLATYSIASGAANKDTAIREAARNGFMEGVATLNAGSGSTDSSNNESTAPITTTFNIRAANRLGNPAAKLTLIEFADFQCPYCERWFQQVEPQIIQQYVQTGKVSIVYKHMAFLGIESNWAAEAAECAADQNKFWEYHNYLYSHQAGENQGAFTKDKLIGFAQQLGLDMSKFTPCLNTDATYDRVTADKVEGQNVSVSSTPSFFLNGQRIVGAQAFNVFQAAIDKALTQ